MLQGWIESLPLDVQTALWTTLTASLVSVMCAILGVWIVLQRMSMLGDAISHSVLPGLVLTFIFFGTKATVPMFLGAVAAGVATVFLTRAISGLAGLRDDASMGVVFTVLFAVGVILITRFARQVDLDPGCVLYGLIEFVVLDTTTIDLGGLGALEVPRAFLTLGPALLLSVAFCVLLRKELTLMAFDPGLARALGKRPDLLYYALMGIVAIATVASFESVGSILVIAMLVAPAATAQLLTRKLRQMFGISVAIALLSSILGYASAVRWNTSVAGMMSLVSGMLYATALVFSPQGGLLHSAYQRARRRRAVQEEDLLAAVYRLREAGTASEVTSVKSLLGDYWFSGSALRRLLRNGLLYAVGDRVQLSARGLESAQRLVRRHRLLESFLVEEMKRPPDEVHVTAHRGEHYLDQEAEAEIASRVRGKDPHGRDIP